MDDLISRKQVLNASHFVACWDGVEHFSLEVVDADFIQKLPSVQPTQSNAQSTQINTLDCVSRQAAIDAVVSAMIDGADAELVEGVMELLPSAQPKCRTGKWIQVTNSFAYCNQCGEPAPYWAMSSNYHLSNYCPSCGADMRGESE